MQRKASASLDFIEDTVESKPAFGENVATAMNANATFPLAPHNNAAMVAANTDLATKTAGALSGDHNKLALRNASEKSWDDIFRDNANYVTGVSAGDVVKITSAGFKATVTETTPTQIPDVPSEPDFTTNQIKGSVKCKTNAVPGAVAYVSVLYTDPAIIQFKPNQIIVTLGDKTVSIVFDTHKVVDHNNLPSHVDFQAVVAAFNRAGMGPYTNPEEIGTL